MLIHQTLSGDDRAFEILVGRYQSAVFGWIRQTLPYAEQDEDLVQEVSIQAYFNLDTLREPHKFKGWLKQIVENVCCPFTISGMLRTPHGQSGPLFSENYEAQYSY